MSRRQPRETESRITKLPVELRSARSRRIGGHAAVFGVKSRPLGGFIETIDHRAFNRAAGMGFPDVVCRFNHDDNMILGTVNGGTLQLTIDDRGLVYLVDCPEARGDVVELVGRGDISQSSFAFECVEDDWDHKDGTTMRTLLQVRLLDCAPVVRPAYPDASVGLRSLARFKDAAFEDVADLAQKNELRRLFVATQPHVTAKPGDRRVLSGPDAVSKIIDRRYGPDEADADGRPRTTKTGHQAVIEIQAKRWTPNDIEGTNR